MTICVIWLVGFSVEVVLPCLVQKAGEASLLKNGFKPGSSLSRAKAGNCTTEGLNL